MIESTNPMRPAARRLRHLTLAGIVLLALLTLLASALLLGGASSGAVILSIDTAGLPPVPAAFVQLVSGFLLAVALFRLARMLRRVEEGRLFETASGLRGFAFYLFLSVIVALLLPPLIQLALAVVEPGPQQVTLSLGGENVLMLFVTGLLFLVARLLDEAQRVAEDAAQIV